VDPDPDPQHCSEQWNLRGGRGSSVEYSTVHRKKKNLPNNPSVNFSLGKAFKSWLSGKKTAEYKF
jgi:hypothetical protein